MTRTTNRRRFLQVAIGSVAASIVGCSHDDSPELPPVLSEDVAFAFDAAGNRYEMDFRRDEVRRVEAGGAVAWRQGSLSDPDLFNSPTSMVVDAQGTVYVADRGNGEVDTLNADGRLRSTFGQDLLTAEDIALDAAGSTLYVSDGAAHRIQVFGLEGAALRTIGAFGTDAGGLNRPRGIAISPRGELHVVDSGNGRIQVYASSGAFLRSYGGSTADAGALQIPRDIVFDAHGSAIVSDTMSNRLAWFDEGGAFRRHTEFVRADGKVGAPLYLAIGPGNRLYATVTFA